MRCNWRRWLWGVIPLVGLGLVAVQIERHAIEQDLAARARQALAAKGADWAVVNFSGRNATVTGKAISENEPGEAVAVLRGVWGVANVKSNAGLPKLVDPYVWSAHRRGNRVRLKGHYPNRTMRQTIVGMTRASLPGLELVDAMRLARGVPETDTWLAGVSFALKQLAALKRGEVRLEGLALTITGEAENAESYRAATAALKRGLPKGVTLAQMQIAAPVVSPFVWSAEFAGGQLVLSGYVASESARTDLLAAARAAASADVVDRMEVAGGAPGGSAEAAAALVKQIVRLQSGSAEMKDAVLAVGGVAADDAQAQAVREGLRSSLPAAFKLTDQIRVREPKVEPKAETKIETKPAETAPSPPAEPKTAAPAEPPPPAVEEKKAEAPPPPAVEEKKAEAPPPPAVEEKKVEAPPPPAVEEKKAEAPAPPPAEKGKETALLTPPMTAPEAAPAEKKEPPSAPKSEAVAAAPEVKSAPPGEAKQVEPPPPKAEKLEKAEAPPPPKVKPAPAPAVDRALCRAELAKLAAGNPIQFERGSAKLESAGIQVLDELARAIKGCPGARIVAEGHTDIEGSPDYNKRLSLKRANVVAEHLIEAGVAADAIETAGFGTSRPVAPNTKASTRAKNRRTEIMVRP
jgi:outer membrane protein OmpA-like peptidoglycan-associated protein